MRALASAPARVCDGRVVCGWCNVYQLSFDICLERAERNPREDWWDT